MSAQPIGIVTALQARRAGLVANMSQTAKHANFPKLFARPLPPPSTADQAAINRLQREKDGLVKENAELRQTVATLQAHLASSTVQIAQNIAERKNTLADVVAAFLIELNARRDQSDELWTVGHLNSARRSRTYSMPRHVCIWLVRQLCMQVSLPSIAKSFGNRDHTSAMHACARAPHWLLTIPKLKAAADATLLRFGGERLS